MAELKFIVSMDSSAFKDGAKDVVAQVKQISNEVKKEGNNIQKEFDSIGAGMGKSLGKYLAAFGGAAIFKDLISNVVRVRSEFQKAGVAIETMLGSKSKADALMQQVKQIAASSPLEFSDITRATQQMLSFNIAAEDAPKYIKAIGDVSMGEKDRFASLSLAFSQMSATGKLMGQDLLQMINAGFNPLAEISRTTGKSIAQLKDEMSKGAISAEMVQQAFISATSAGGKFFGMSENAAKTISGQMSMLSDAVSAAFNEVGEKSEGMITGAIQATTTLVKNYETILKVLAALVVNYGVYRAASAAVIAIDNANGVSKALLAIKTDLLAKKQAVLNAVMSVNPYVAATMALSALVTLLVVAATSESNYERSIRKANEAIAEQENRLEERKNNIDALINIIRDETKTTYQQIKAYEQLKQLAPELTKEYSREALAKMESAKAQKILNEDMEAAEYDEAVKEVERLTKAIEEQKRVMNQPNAAGSFGMAGNAMAEQQRMQLQELEAGLERWTAKLNKIRETQKKVAEEAKPIEVRIKEAEGNKKVQEDILKFWDSAAKKIDELSHPNMVMTFEGSKQQLDAYIDEVKGTLANLQKDLDKHPNDAHLQLKQEEGQKILNILIKMREAWIASGNTTLPITLQAEMSEQLTRIMASVKNAKDTLNKLFNIGKEDKKSTTTATTKKTHKTAAKSTKDDKLEAERKQREFNELVAQQERERKRELTDLEINSAQAEIDALDDGTDKVIRQLKLDYRKREEEITREYEDLKQTKIDKARELFEADPKNKNKLFDPKSVDTSYTEAEDAYFEQLRKANQKGFERDLNKALLDQRQALRDLLKEYGDYEQQRLAIAEEYADKIKQADSPDKAAQLQLEQERKLRELEQKAFEDTIDWDGVFSSLEGHTKEYLQGLAEQLQKVIKDGALPPDQLAVVQAKLVDINAEITKQGGLFDFIGTKQREHTRLVQEAANAQEALTTAQEEQRRAEEAYEGSKQSVVDFLMQAYGSIAQPLLDAFRAFEEEVEAGKASFEDFNPQDILDGLDVDSDEYKQLFGILTALRVNEMKLGQARIKTSKATSEATKSSDKARRTSAQSVADWFDGVTEYIKKHGIDQIPALLGNLGLEEAGKRAEKGLSAINNAAGAAADFASGNYIGAATKAIQSLFDIGDLFGIGGSSDKNLERDIERLTASNDALRDAVENLTDEMQSGAVAKAPEIYKTIVDDINKSMANTREMMQRSGAAYDSGKLGIFGGTHSSNKRINDNISADQWSEISRITGASVRSAADFWGLTSKQMSEVARRAPEVYARIKDLADDGYKDAAQFMDDYINYWRELEEAENAYYEKLTGVSQDTITSDFVNALKDMDSSAADFADNFEKYLKDAIINALVSNEFEPLIEDWYKNFATAAETNGIDQSEADKLRKEWDNITEQGLKRRQEIQDLFDWGSTGEGSGAYKALATFSQEKGDELNGRLTAIQIGQQRNNESLLSAVTTLQNLSVVVAANQGALSEMRNLMLIGNGYLEDIARYTKLTSQNSELLQTIATKIDTL